ncbi:MAG: methyltransferase domain-containing protein [Nitrospira sp.]|nr:methyltransferase domain-containing protein [Nitrospira sp.]
MRAPLSNRDLQAELAEHLKWWGLRRFESDEAYFQWQRGTLGRDDLAELSRLAERKRASDKAADEIAFYDRTAGPRVLPVLYSQRFDYYATVGLLIAQRIAERIERHRSDCGTIPSALSVLDFGCGIGLLTTFYARQFPSLSFVGLDRSSASLAVAREKAGALGLANVRFDCLDLQESALTGTYDIAISTQALLQAEFDPGLPSKAWHAFERAVDAEAQSRFEERTGLGARLDRLCAVLASDGCLILLEKTRQLARRIPFQRALAERGLGLLAQPEPIRYRVVEELSDDGPLYVLGRSSRDAGSAGLATGFNWDETPEPIEEGTIYRCRDASAESVYKRLPERVAGRETTWVEAQAGSVRAEWGRFAGVLAYLYLTVGERFHGILVGGQGKNQELDCRIGRYLLDPGRNHEGGRLDAVLEETWPQAASTGEEDLAQAPLYENHTAYAQAIWDGLPGRTVLRSLTDATPDGGQRRVELGSIAGPGLVYLYQATTFDQRQLVLVEQERSGLLEMYYQELASEGASAAG